MAVSINALDENPSVAEIQQHLQRILSSQPLVRSKSLSRFLTYLVEQTCQQRGDLLKEYSIGVEVFDRGESFDSRDDTIVRVQARTLRARLLEYYAGEGAADTMRIELPKGGYTLDFIRVPAPAPPQEKRKSARPLWIAAACLLLVGAAAWLATWGLANKSSDPPTIAVLPFANLDHNPDTNYFSDELAEELINSLVKLNGLGVVARSSSFRFRDLGENLQQVGKQLNANHILEGSVRRTGNHVRVTARLVDVRSGHTTWSSEYDRDLNDLARTEQEIAIAIAETLKLRLVPPRIEHSGNAPSAEVYDLYLKGRYYWQKTGRKEAAMGIAYFEQAIAADPSYAQAYVGLAGAENTQAMLGLAPAVEAWARTKALLTRALELDDSNAEAHTLMAGVRAWYEWDYALGEAEYRRGIELAPGDPIPHQYYASYLGAMGRAKEADAEMEKALRLDPFNLLARWGKAQLLVWKGDLKGARSLLEALTREDRNFTLSYRLLASVLAEMGEYQKARDVLAEFALADPTDPNQLGYEGFMLAKMGQSKRAREILAELDELGRTRYVSSLVRSQIYLGLGDRQKALDYLAQACEERSIRPPHILVDPRFRELKGVPGFQDLMKRVNLAH